MKVIVAGLGKTGTKSMAAALKQLGYNVYDVLEHIQFHGENWINIFNKGAVSNDFKKMYKDVDAVTDFPACYFWDEILNAFPDAKIILTIRENEDDWCNSMLRQNRENIQFLRMLTIMFSPSFYRMKKFGDGMFNFIFGIEGITTPFKGESVWDLSFRMCYRRHNAHVMMNAPKDKLLVFQVKEGWEPLCKFLEVDVPQTPFPHRNKNCSIAEEAYNTHPHMLQMRKESKIVFFVIVIIISVVVMVIFS